MLALDTLQWSILDPHPLGFSAPSLHGHTTVEDPTRAGRLIVFGGRGGNTWNTQVCLGMMGVFLLSPLVLIVLLDASNLWHISNLRTKESRSRGGRMLLYSSKARTN